MLRKTMQIDVLLVKRKMHIALQGSAVQQGIPLSHNSVESFCPTKIYLFTDEQDCSLVSKSRVQKFDGRIVTKKREIQVAIFYQITGVENL